jgi:23S rRNA (cytidine1920-2'-O)/16S rRNA (cytidine1409-2'-O)-methyltransferase
MPDAVGDHSDVSRGVLKLAHALDAFSLDPTSLICADLGCSVGGFTQCLIRRGAARVHAVDTGYGQLAWVLRKDPRVVVHERTNALFAAAAEPVDLVVIDLGWTKQDRAIPAALTWLRQSPSARIITLIKPHYERGTSALNEDRAREIAEDVRDRVLPTLGVRVIGFTQSPVLGGAVGAGNKTKGTGNAEWLALLARDEAPEHPACC